MLDGTTQNQTIHRRRSKSKRRRSNECDSGAALIRNTSTAELELTLEIQDASPQKDDLYRDGLPPKVIRSSAIKRPIHIEPTTRAANRITAPPPQPTSEIFQAIAGAYNLTPQQCRELLDALTKARLILGYKNPIVRLIQPAYYA